MLSNSSVNSGVQRSKSEREYEKEIEDLCFALIGEKPVQGMPGFDAAEIIIKALRAGLRAQFKNEGLSS